MGYLNAVKYTNKESSDPSWQSSAKNLLNASKKIKIRDFINGNWPPKSIVNRFIKHANICIHYEGIFS